MAVVDKHIKEQASPQMVDWGGFVKGVSNWFFPGTGHASEPSELRGIPHPGIAMGVAPSGPLGRDYSTLNHPVPTHNAMWGGKVFGGNNVDAAPVTPFTASWFKVFSEPRGGQPGANPGGVNNTASPAAPWRAPATGGGGSGGRGPLPGVQS